MITELDIQDNSQFQDQIKLFYDMENVQAPLSSPKYQRKRYPRLNNSLMDLAITLNFLDYSKKEKLLKDPNKLSIFFVNLNPQSPMTRESLQKLSFQPQQCQTLTFEEFYQNPKEDPLKILIEYMYYMQEQYKIIQQILHKRNNLKKNSILEQRRLNKSQFRSVQHLDSINGLGTSNICNRNKSFHNHSIDSVIASFDERLEIQKKKQQTFQKTYSRYVDGMFQQIQDYDEYYDQLRPQEDEKVKKVQDMLKKQWEERMKIRHHKLNKTMGNIKQMHEAEGKHRKLQDQELKLKLEQTETNRQKLLDERANRNQDKEIEGNEQKQIRLQKKQIAILLEAEEIEQIIEKSNYKELRCKQHIEVNRQNLLVKIGVNQQTSATALHRVHVHQNHKERANFEKFFDHQEVVMQKIEGQERMLQKQITDRQARKELRYKKAQENRHKQDLLKQQKTKALLDQEYAETEKLQKFQITLDQKLQTQMYKNRERFDKVSLQCLNNQQDIESKYHKTIDRLQESNQRISKLKGNNQSLKDVGIKTHYQMKQQMETIMLSKLN